MYFNDENKPQEAWERPQTPPSYGGYQIPEEPPQSPKRKKSGMGPTIVALSLVPKRFWKAPVKEPFS